MAAATEHADQEVWDVNLKGKIALVVGERRRGRLPPGARALRPVHAAADGGARWNPSMWRRPPRPACTSGSVRTARLRAEEGEGPAVGRQRKKLLIVDGYNVLRSGIRYRRIEDPTTPTTPSTSRASALSTTCVNYAGNDWRAIIVFDGGRNAFSTGETENRGRRAHHVQPGGPIRRQGHREAGPRRARAASGKRLWSPATPPSKTPCSATAATA